MLPYRTPDIVLQDSPSSSNVLLHAPQPHASTSRSQSYQSTAPSAYKYSPNPEEEEETDVFDPFSIDPDYRLRTVRTAHSVIAESIRSEHDAEQRKRKRRLFSSIRSKNRRGTLKESFRRKSSAGTDDGAAVSEHGTPRASLAPPLLEQPEPEEKEKSKEPAGQRRALYVNLPLPTGSINLKGDPTTRYPRNKIRTSKYTIITFIPKNLFEQFRRAANIFFLACVLLQLFPVFGAPNAQIGMLPLLAILGMTAIKDGVEDWRRARLDDEVNNSAATKLGGWRNVNQPVDPRTFFEKLLGASPPDKPSKGVRKLRDAEAKAGNEIVVERQKEIEEEEELGSATMAQGQYPPDQPRVSVSSDRSSDGIHSQILRKIPSAPSVMSRKSTGVVDWSSQSRGTAHWERTLWKKLEVGDFVLLRDNEQIPADIVVLATSHADSLAFVETKNLDGETNLKIRKSLKATSSMQAEEDLERAHFVIDSEPPHANLYSYNGVLKYWPSNGKQGIAGVPGEEKQEAITINELLLRGCMIRNTKWVIGMVLFTGEDTKIMLNGGDTPSKRSKIEKETNFNVVMNFVILILLCLITAILHGWYRSLSGTSANSFEAGSWAADNIYLDSVIIFFSCLIVFQNIVPISLYITIEIVKTIQAFFIFQDVEMYYEPYDTPCVPKSWNISDDLGQIEYVFSDKTGTLTQNIMEFKKCSVRGVSFGEGITEAMLGAAKRDGRDTGTTMEDQEEELAVLKDRMVTSMTKAFDNRYFREDMLTLVAPELPSHFADPNDSLRPHLIEFFRALAICHSVLSDVPDPKKPFEVDYKAESPDEAALVAAARDVGFPFVNRNNTRIDVEVLGKAEKWVPLRVLEFNSTRKRMSVLARDPSGRVVLFCKGADSVIYERLAADHDPTVKASTLRDLETFANGGLRTLCIAQRYLSDEEYESWVKKFDAASAAIVDREAEIEKACELVEHSLTILGATALEDKLQEGVPDAIATLHRAGIKLWILTGDKLQTAIEIGYSCNLLTNDMEVMIISADSEQGARAQIEAGLNKIASVLGPPVVNKRRSMVDTAKAAATFAVVIDGDSLRYALQPSLKSLFLSLGTQCAAVICCRVSPSQKALTVKLVKDGCNAMTLSIGDGANDVAMIQEANVGVGLFGLEGSQAAMSADYAFGQFRFLTRLLLVHGRWSYVRIADMHANFFYKNIIWTISMFWFLIFNSFDATYLFEYTFLLLYNLVFTSLPVGILGMFDQDTNAKASMAFPQLYKRGIQGLEYTRKRFWTYMTDGLYQSCIIFFIPYLAHGGGVTWSSDGMDTDSLWDLGTTVAAAGVFAANLYVGINTRYWMFISWIVTIGSILLCYIWIPIYSALSTPPYNGTVDVVYPTFTFWATVILTVAFAVGPRWLASAVRQSYFPRDKDIIREAWIAGDLKDQLGLEHRKKKKNKAKKGLDSNGRAEQRGGEHEGDLGRDLEMEIGNPDARYMDHVRSGLGDDGRGMYAPAAMASPQKSPGGLLSSEQSTPRSAYGYGHAPLGSPLVDQLSPTLQTAFAQSQNQNNQAFANVPPPLLGRGSPGTPPIRPPRPEMARGYSDRSGGLHPPVSDLEYVSPSAIHTTFQETSKEIGRLDEASGRLKRASLIDTPGNLGGGGDKRMSVQRSSSDRRPRGWGEVDDLEERREKRRSSLGDPLSTLSMRSQDWRDDAYGGGGGNAYGYGGYEDRRDGPTVDLTDVDVDGRGGNDVRRDGDDWPSRARGQAGQAGQAGVRKSYVDFSAPRGDEDW